MSLVKNNRLMSILLVVAIGFYIYYLYGAVRWIPYPNSTDYGEGFVMNYAKLWANGTWKWDINMPPYLTMVYGVGFPILATPFVNLFGSELWVGRAMSFGASLVVCLLIYLIVQRLTGKKSYGLLAALLPATQPIFRDWSVLARVDMIAVMFDLLGFYLVLRFKNSKWVYLVIIPFLIAPTVKLTAIAGLIAAMTYFIMYDRKLALKFGGLCLALLVAILAVLQAISGGEYFKHVFLYQNTIMNFNFGTFLFIFQQLIYPFMIILVFGAMYVKRCFSKSLNLPSLFFISALVIDIFTSFKSGAAGMYYFELIIATSICAVLVLPYLLESWRASANYAIIGLLVVLFAATSPFTNMPFPDEKFNKGVATVESIMADSQKPIIAEIPSMSKEPYIEFFVFTNLTRLGYWDESDYLDKYRSQYFDYVLLRVPIDKRMEYMADGEIDGDFTNNALLVINANYSLVYQSVGEYWPNSLYLYEANDKLKIDNREIIKGFLSEQDKLKEQLGQLRGANWINSVLPFGYEENMLWLEDDKK